MWQFFRAVLLLISAVFFCTQNYAAAMPRQFVHASLVPSGLLLHTDQGDINVTFYNEQTVQVHYLQSKSASLPSFSINSQPKPIKLALTEQAKTLRYASAGLTVVVHKSPFYLSFVTHNQTLLREDTGFFNQPNALGVRFKLSPNEKILGGGERVVGMDRRGQLLPLYNKAHYGYSDHSLQMNYSLPAVLSSKKYMLLFDNTAKGMLDIGSTEPNILKFSAVAGRLAYIVIAGQSYPELLHHYVQLTGTQPMPPRWAFGSFASRFGYHTEQQARAVVAQYKALDVPLDAIIFDLYWFGKAMKGTMGNLSWDRQQFPTPEAMIDDFAKQGIQSIVITEPFVIEHSKQWRSAVAQHALALDKTGQVKTFDFFFGHTGLVDVFSSSGQQWFKGIYGKLLKQGITGWWGDLGEPEVHPADTIHALGSADELHNVYGQQWAKLIFDEQRTVKPNMRPFLLMRAGFLGAQRYGVMPWTGDVSRTWGGLKAQIELSLQMSLFGLAYTHSDLGGFVGDKPNEQLYLRWLQYGVFQPVFRPHAQEAVPPEPIYHSQKILTIVRKFIKLRYALLPYNYSLAYQNSRTGMPLMRPLFFENEQDDKLIDNDSSYLWGDAFLVTPITQPNLTTQVVTLPKGVWFDFFTNQREQGNRTIQVAVSEDTLPVYVRAGAFVPMVAAINTTKNYSSAALTLHYYADPSVAHSQYQMYDDDGKTYAANQRDLFELLNFNAQRSKAKLTINFSRITHGYAGMPKSRMMELIIHHLRLTKSDRTRVIWQHRQLSKCSLSVSKTVSQACYFKAKNHQLHVKFKWLGNQARLTISPLS